MKLDMQKFAEAVGKSRYTMRQIHGSFGGRRRVESWGKRCDPRTMRGVSRALGVPVASLCIDDTVQTVAVADTVEQVVDAVAEQVVEEKKKKKHPSQMNKEELIVLAHELDPDIDLPSGATKKELIAIIKGLK